MLKQIPAPDHLIALKLDGKLSAEDVQTYHSILEKKLLQHAQIGIYVDLTDLTDMTANALIEGTKADLVLFSHLKQLSRCAFVSDKEWPQTLISAAQHLLPVLDLKIFPSSQSEKALAWAAELRDTTAVIKPAIRFLATSKADVLAFEVNGLITSEEMPDVIKQLEDFFAAHDKVRLLNRMKNFAGFDPLILMQSSLISMKLTTMNRLERYAIVGAPNWMCKAVDAINPLFTDIDIQTFSADQEDQAWAWLDAELVE